MEKKNFYRQLRLSCVVLMAVFALSASAQSSRQVRPYSFNKKGVFYGRQPVMGIDIRTFVDLGYGYAKDRYNVYFEGQILPFVDPMTFRLKVPGSVYQGGYPAIILMTIQLILVMGTTLIIMKVTSLLLMQFFTMAERLAPVQEASRT